MSRARYGRAAYPARRGWFGRWFDYALALLILALLLLVTARLDEVSERARAGQAMVHDGDTLTVDGERIRLRGIDAPEYNQACQLGEKSYACGRRAREALTALITDKAVTCSGWERDKFRRLLAVCTVGDPPLQLNRKMVLKGWAVDYGGYRAEEDKAREKAVGIWQGDFVRPREWRQAERRDAEPQHDLLGQAMNWLRQIFGS